MEPKAADHLKKPGSGSKSECELAALVQRDRIRVETEAVESSPHRIIRLPHYQNILTAFQVVGDSCALLISFLFGFYQWQWLGPQLAIDLYEAESFSRYYLFVGVSLITILVGLETHGLYKPQRSLMNVREFELLLKVWGKACLFTVAVLFLAHQLYFSRGVFVLTWANLLLLLMVERYGLFKFKNYLRRKGFVETSCRVEGSGVGGRKLLG
jgi:FlaA1/EpsC-like NDP-sugar epimerase